MKEIICINIGQAGVQISNSCWELFCIEHGLDCGGNLRSTDNSFDRDPSNLDVFFHETKEGNNVPRSISVDLEPSVLDEIRSGPYRHLWNPDCLINGIEDASGNFARGYISVGKYTIDELMRMLRKLVEDCEMLHGLLFLHSYVGGTGSGFTNLILDYISSEYSKTTHVASTVFPSPEISTSMVEPYNCLLSSLMSQYNIDIALLSDNQCLYEICLKKLMIQRPTFQNINRLLSQLYSSLTVTLRFGSSLDHDIVHLQTNLVPFPRIHFPIATFAPLCDQATLDHEGLSTVEMTHELFSQENTFITCKIQDGKYIACCLNYRGLVKPSDVHSALMEIKKRKDITFVDWSPVGFKVGISPMPPASVIRSQLAESTKNCSMFINSTSIEDIWSRIHNKFRMLFHKKAFLHWYIGEGMEESEFRRCEEGMCELRKDYKEIEHQSEDWLEDFSHKRLRINEKTESEIGSAEIQNTDSVDIQHGNTNNNLLEEIEKGKLSIYRISKVSCPTVLSIYGDQYYKNRHLLNLFHRPM